MITSPYVRLAPEEKLALLRRLDRYREWESLDERRLCLQCGMTITGRQIEISGGKGAFDPMRVTCPTEGCASVPMDWSRPENLNRDATVAEGSDDPADQEEAASNEVSRPAAVEAEAVAHRILVKAYRAFSRGHDKTKVATRSRG